MGMDGLKSTLTTTALSLDKASVPEKLVPDLTKDTGDMLQSLKEGGDCEKINRVG